jgi:catechol 2,3-dioxygenase
MTRDIAHVSAVELFSAVPDDTVAFFQDLMAMEVVGRRDDSVYLHAWDDYERFTVKVTRRTTAGVGRTWLRASSPDALRRRVKVIEAAGLGHG